MREAGVHARTPAGHTSAQGGHSRTSRDSVLLAERRSLPLSQWGRQHPQGGRHAFPAYVCLPGSGGPSIPRDDVGVGLLPAVHADLSEDAWKLNVKSRLTPGQSRA